MTKPMADVLEFLSAFIAGGVNQDFKPWAKELYAKLYGSSVEPTADDRDAARYRYLRDDHAYEPEEQAVRGGADLDDLCDAGIALNRSVTTEQK